MKVLVTGGAGFIGSHLVDSLLASGHEVAVVDDLSSGHKEYLPTGISFWQQSIDQSEPLTKIFSTYQPEIIFHLAAQKDVRLSIKNPSIDARINILGTLNLLELSLVNNVKKFIFASSGGAIYDAEDRLPLTELARAKPLSPYGLTKYVVDKYLEIFFQLKNLNYTSLRLANVYGPRQDPFGEAGVVAIFFKQLIKGEKVFLNGGGLQTRDFVYVKDVAEAFNQAAQVDKCGIFNIGTSKETSIVDLFQLQKKVCQKNIEAIKKSAIAGEVVRNALDYTQAKKYLNWKPKYDLLAGLEETYTWFRNKIL